VPDLVWLNISAQVLNVFLLPLVIAFLVALATEALPEPIRLRGWYLGLIIGISAIVCAVGLFGASQVGFRVMLRKILLGQASVVVILLAIIRYLLLRAPTARLAARRKDRL